MKGKFPSKRVGSRAQAKRDRLVAQQTQADISAVLTRGLKEAIERDLAEGRTASEITKKWEPAVAAKALVIALTEIDSGKAMTAIKDVRDRTSGRPKEHLELSGKWEKIPDEQLNAMVLSAMRELAGEGKEGEGAEVLSAELVQSLPSGEDQAP